MNVLNYDSRRFFLLGMRICFGIFLLNAGLMKWFIIKPGVFVGMIAKQFDGKTWSPHLLNVSLAWLIMIAEVVLPLLLLSGLKPRLTWTLITALMFLLAFGQSISMNDPISNWQYTIMALACAALSDPEKPANEVKNNV